MAKSKTSTSKSKSSIIYINKTLVLYFCLFVLVGALSLFNLSLYVNERPQEITTAADPFDTNSQKISFWKSFLEVHPDYFEGWLELSRLELKAGNPTNAESALFNATKINPNSPEIDYLQNEIRQLSWEL